jgi:hypothetical protein
MTTAVTVSPHSSLARASLSKSEKSLRSYVKEAVHLHSSANIQDKIISLVADYTSEGIRILSVDELLGVLQFSDPSTAASAEKVCRQWKDLINTPDQCFWKSVCEAHYVAVPCPAIEAALPFSQKDIALQIDGYVRNYREEAFTRSTVKVALTSSPYILSLPKDGVYAARWGNDAREPMVSVTVFSDYPPESPYICDWQINPPYGVERFVPGNLYFPLRLLIDKKKGDKVEIDWKGSKVVLTCTHKKERRDGTVNKTFHAAIKYRISTSIACSLLTEEWVETARKASATAISGEWIGSD